MKGSVSSSYTRLLKAIVKLRDPTGGCPWDRAQDHRSLRTYALEEAHELVEAINTEDDELLIEELGDVLLQVLLHSQIASDRNAFSIDDVCTRLAEKLVRRHPHVFGHATGTLEAVCARWDHIKSSEGKSNRPFAHPALIAARKILRRLPAAFSLAGVQTRDEEEQAGLRLLESLAELVNRGLDPEVVIRRGIAALHRSLPDEENL